MTYCVEHPLRKMLLMPVEPFEPNKSCYVCSETPLLLEVNIQKSRLKDFVEKIVKRKLGMNCPLIMHGSTLLYEEGDDLEDDVAANYASNIEKVLAELPSPITSGTILTVEDLQQELSCHINVKHREEFDEEKEHDQMVLSGWTSTPTKNDLVTTNGGSTAPEATSDDKHPNDVEIVHAQSGVLVRNKRKVSQISVDSPAQADDGVTSKEMPAEVFENDDEDAVVMLDGDWQIGKKKKLL